MKYSASFNGRTLKLALVFCMVAGGLLTANPAEAAFDITRRWAQRFFYDSGSTPQYDAMYACIGIQNTGGSTVPDVWVKIDSFTGSVGLANYEDGVHHLGPMPAGQPPRPAYFFLKLSPLAETAVSQSYTVTVYDRNPSLPGAVNLGSQVILILEQKDGISANANKVTGHLVLPNDSAILGSTGTLTIHGDLGNVGAGDYVTFSPAILSSWRADKLQLYSSTVVVSNNFTDSDLLGYSNTVNTAHQYYSITYLFRLNGVTSGSIAMSPSAYIASGTQAKYHDPADDGIVFPQIVNAVVLGKTVSTNLLTNGGTVTYSLILSNQSTENILVDDFTDTLPSGVTYVGSSSFYNGGAIADPTTNGNVLTWSTIFSLPASSTRTLTFSAVIPDVVGSYTNSAVAHIGSTQIDTTLDTTDDSPAKAVTIVGSLADLITVKTGPATTTNGVVFTYTIAVTNNGPSTATNIVVNDTLPANVAFQDASGSWTTNGTVVSWALFDLSSGAYSNFTVFVIPTATGSLTNTASAVSPIPDPNGANNTNTFINSAIAVVNLSIVKTGDTNLVNGVLGSYSLLVSNAGPSAAVGATVTDVLPAGWIATNTTGDTSSPGLVTWTGIDLAKDAWTNLTLQVWPSGSGSQTNTAVAAVNGTSVTNTLPVTVVDVAGLIVDKTGPSTATNGVEFGYSILVSNTGPSVASNVTVTDGFPMQWTPTNTTGNTSVPGFVTWTGINLDVNATTNLSLGAITTNNGTQTNFAYATSVAGNSNTDSVPTTVSSVVNLSIVKTGDTNLVNGVLGSYSLLVSNAGPSAAVGATVTDVLPDGWIATNTTGDTSSPGLVTWTGIDLAKDAWTNLTLQVWPSGSGSQTNTAVAAVDGTSVTNTLPVTVTSLNDLSVVKTAPETITTASTFDYTIVVSNSGPSTATSLVVTDSLPETVTFLSANPSATTNASNQVIWDSLGSLAAGATTTLTVSVRAPLAGEFTNNVTATSPEQDDNSENNSSQVIRYIQGVNLDAFVYLDSNINTNKDIGETGSGLPVVYVKIYSGTYTNWAAVDGFTGAFTFSLLPPGDYTMLVSTNNDLSDLTPSIPDGWLGTQTPTLQQSLTIVLNSEPTVENFGLAAAQEGVVLFIEKSADRKEAEIGDIVKYTIDVKNIGLVPLSGVYVDDRLPAGFAYLHGTTRTNNVTFADPVGAPGPHLTFTNLTLAAGETISLTYRVRIVPGALQGNGRNRAQAFSTQPAGASNEDSVRIIVKAGVFSDKPFLIGKVFVDENTNKIQDAGEPGVPGVRLYLNNGTYVITDKEGKYSLYGLEAQTHVVKVDETTLPAGWQGEQLTARHNRRGTLYTADLKFGELRKVDFASAGNQEVLDEVKRRIAKGDVDVAEVQRVGSAAIPSSGQYVAGSTTGASSGTVAGNGEYVGPVYGPVMSERTLNSGNSTLPARAVLAAPTGEIGIGLPAADQYADGQTPVTIQVKLTDPQGAALTGKTIVTLQSSLGRWQTADLDADETGLQVAAENGAVEAVLLPPGEPGTAKIVASSGAMRGETQLAFLPDLRPLIAAGVIEGRLQFHKLSLNKLEPVRSGDVFERELKNWSVTGNDGRFIGGARGSVFLKGKIKGDYLLTLAYDSEKDFRDKFMRDIQPDEYYPVYGDSSVRGFDAQTANKLYVRVDKRKCYVLYGDYNIGAESPARGLGQYSRSATGIKAHFENQHGVANVWGMYDSLNQRVEEFRADGTSGPYYFTIRSKVEDIIENTEKVEIIVRDRNQSAVILSVTPMVRFVDYEFEPFAGRLLFRAPIPSLDANLNPISIRVTYEVDQGGEKFWVAGADGQLKLTSYLEVGGSLVQDRNPLNEYNLISGNMTLQVLPKTYLLAEVARSQSDLGGTGFGWRAELRRASDMTDLRLFASRVDDKFENPSSVISAGREEVGGRVTHKLTPQDLLLAEAIYTRDVTTGGERWGMSGSYAHKFNNGIQVELGLRHSEENIRIASPTNTTAVADNTVNALRARVTAPVPYTTNVNVFAEYEQEVSKGERRAVTVGGDIQVAAQTKAYFRHEFLTALDSPYDLNGEQKSHRTVFGLQTEYMKDGQLFNEYRMDSGTSGREAEAAIGLRNAWQLRQGLRLHTNFERVEPLTEGGNHDVATAAGVGIEYTADPAYRATARIEGRKSDTAASILHTLGYARKLSEDWTLLTRSILNWRDDESLGAGDLFQARLQLGAAWRQTRTDVWNALGRFEYLYEDDNTDPTDRLRRHVFIFSTHANWQPCANLTLSGRYSQKIVIEDDDTIDDVFGAHLIAGRVMYDVTKRWAVGVNGSVFFSDAFRNVQFGLGPEIGFRLNDNVWLDAGYNFAGFHDRDLSGDNYTDHGFWFGMRMQFDERALEFLKPNRQK